MRLFKAILAPFTPGAFFQASEAPCATTETRQAPVERCGLARTAFFAVLARSTSYLLAIRRGSVVLRRGVSGRNVISGTARRGLGFAALGNGREDGR